MIKMSIRQSLFTHNNYSDRAESLRNLYAFFFFFSLQRSYILPMQYSSGVRKKKLTCNDSREEEKKNPVWEKEKKSPLRILNNTRRAEIEDHHLTRALEITHKERRRKKTQQWSDCFIPAGVLQAPHILAHNSPICY